jgi:predicted nucleotidyltransferase component of viral defense system
MTAYDAFYEESLYPLQDGVLKAIAASHSRFYLTGGTAIGRVWFGHRYSDDLDLFLNADPAYATEAARVLELLEANAAAIGYTIHKDRTVSTKDFTQISLGAGSALLKIDLVNDVATHFGALATSAIYPKVDGLRNMLSNKLSALYRYEPKDVADIWAIAKHVRFSWQDLVLEAREKELGLDASSAAGVLGSFPAGAFQRIKWRERPSPESFAADLARIARDILEGGENGLASPGVARIE